MQIIIASASHDERARVVPPLSRNIQLTRTTLLYGSRVQKFEIRSQTVLYPISTVASQRISTVRSLPLPTFLFTNPWFPHFPNFKSHPPKFLSLSLSLSHIDYSNKETRWWKWRSYRRRRAQSRAGSGSMTTPPSPLRRALLPIFSNLPPKTTMPPSRTPIRWFAPSPTGTKTTPFPSPDLRPRRASTSTKTLPSGKITMCRYVTIIDEYMYKRVSFELFLIAL